MIERQPSDSPFVNWMIRHRETNDWSQRELARQSGVPQSTISRVENGKRRLTLSIAVRVAKSFRNPQS